MSITAPERLPRAMTIREFAAELQVSERHVYELCRTGQIEGAIRMGRRWIIPRRVLEQLLGESEYDPVPVAVEA